MRTSSKNMNALLAADSETGSAIEGLVERQDSAIKAVSSPPPMTTAPPPNADVARMIVIPAGNMGRSSSRNSPRKTSGSRTPSGSVVIDVTARTPSRTASTPTRELDRMYVENRAPARFMCPVSGRIMRDPVILTTGTTCDRGAMERRLAKGHKRDPVTKRPLKKPIHMMPNVELRNAITTWAKKSAPWLLVRTCFPKRNCCPSPFLAFSLKIKPKPSMNDKLNFFDSTFCRTVMATWNPRSLTHSSCRAMTLSTSAQSQLTTSLVLPGPTAQYPASSLERAIGSTPTEAKCGLVQPATKSTQALALGLALKAELYLGVATVASPLCPAQCAAPVAAPAHALLPNRAL